jgi:hypothetical protein
LLYVFAGLLFVFAFAGLLLFAFRADALAPLCGVPAPG